MTETRSDGSRNDDRLYRPGVGAMLIDARGWVLVGRRIDTREEAWQMPQGGIDPGEEPCAAVLRELEEEIGTADAEIVAESGRWRHYDLPAPLAGRMWKGRFRGQRMKWFLLAFTGRESDIRPDRVPRPEFQAWKWAPLDDLPAMIVPFKRPLYEDVVAEFGPLVRARVGL